MIGHNCKQHSKYYQLYDHSIDLIEVDSILLEISLYHLSCLELCYITIDVAFNFEYLFATQ